MITLSRKCPFCGSEDIVKNGYAPNGKQKYLCKACKRQTRENPKPTGYAEEEKEKILRAYEERSSLRGLRRTFGVARNTVTKWIKKKQASCPI
jgi:transposase-like protein